MERDPNETQEKTNEKGLEGCHAAPPGAPGRSPARLRLVDPSDAAWPRRVAQGSRQ
jgi:hypothetical protein